MKIKWQAVFKILALSAIIVLVIQTLHCTYINFRFTLTSLVNAIQKEGLVIQDTGIMEHCTGPLTCGESNMTFEACVGDDCTWGRVVAYANNKEARRNTSSVNGMECLLGMQAFRRGRFVLGTACDDATAEKLSRAFLKVTPD